MYVCVRERERARDLDSRIDNEKKEQRAWEKVCVCVCVCGRERGNCLVERWKRVRAVEIERDREKSPDRELKSENVCPKKKER